MSIELKKKICKTCKKETYIFSKGNCKFCAAKISKKSKNIKKAAKKPTPRKKSLTISQLKKKVWRIFSQYVRLRDSDKDGYCNCITCNKRGYWTKDGMEAGHFRSRRYNSTLFHERNVFAQCTRCNGYNQGESYLYGKALDNKFGPGTADELVALSHKTYSFTRYELEQMYIKYLEKVNILLKNKNLKS